MIEQKYTATILLWITLTFYGMVHAAALRESLERPEKKYIAHAAALLQSVGICRDNAQLCLEYANLFPLIATKRTPIEGQASITCATLLGMRHLLANNKYNNLEVINKETGEKASIKSPHKKPITAMLYQPPYTVITGSEDLTLRAWDIRTGEVSTTFSNHLGTKLLTSAGKTKFVSAANKYVYLWNCDSGTSLSGKCQNSTVNCLLTVSDSEDFLVTAGLDDGSICIFTPESSPIFSSGSKAPITSLARISEHEFVSLDGQSTLRGWSSSKGIQAPLYTVHIPRAHRLLPCADQVLCVPEILHERSLNNNVWRLCPGGIYEQCDLSLGEGYHVDIACSSDNSCTLVARETNDACFANSVDWYDRPKRNVLYSFKRDDASPEEQLDPEVQAWLDETMQPSQWMTYSKKLQRIIQRIIQ